MYRTDGADWSLAQKLVASDPAPANRFGHALSLQGNITIVGAPRADDAGEFCYVSVCCISCAHNVAQVRRMCSGPLVLSGVRWRSCLH